MHANEERMFLLRKLSVPFLAALVSSVGAFAQTGTLTSMSMASYGPLVAPDSIAAGFGSNLALTTASGTSMPLPTTLGNVSVTITDSSGAKLTAPLYLVSPGQINYLIPANTALGKATVTVNGASSATATGTLMPGSTAGTYVTRPINLSPTSDNLYLMLYGTGIRRHSLDPVKVSVGGVDIPVLYAAAQSQYAGLDQVNIGPFPQSLAGKGEVDLVVRVDGIPANTVRVNFQ